MSNKLWDDVFGHLIGEGVLKGLGKFLGTEEGGKVALQVIKDTLERGEAGGEGFSILASELSSDEHQDLHNRFWGWVTDGNTEEIRTRLLRLQRALNFHYKDIKDGVVAQVEVILTGKDGEPTRKEANWPEGFRPEEVFFKTWKAILKAEESHAGAIENSIDYFSMGRRSRLERWRDTLMEWLDESPTWQRIKELAKRFSWGYLLTVTALTILAVLSVGSTLHFALDGKSGQTAGLLGITSLLIFFLYTIRYPLQEAWQIVTDLFGGGGVSWAEQKKTMACRIGYLAAASLVLLLVPFGKHPVLFATALLGLVVAFMLREYPGWQRFGQAVVVVCIILSFVLPGPASAGSVKGLDNKGEADSARSSLSGFVAELPKTVHKGRVYAEEFDGENLFFSTDGEGKFCRPAKSPRGVEEDWWLEHVYPCDGANPGFSPATGLPGRVLSTEEALEYSRQRKEPKDPERLKNCRFNWRKPEGAAGRNPTMRWASSDESGGWPAEVTRLDKCHFEFSVYPAVDGVSRVIKAGWNRCTSDEGWWRQASPPDWGTWKLEEKSDGYFVGHHTDRSGLVLPTVLQCQ